MALRRTCLRCNKPIHNEKSLIAGMGPTCLAIVRMKSMVEGGWDRYDIPFDFEDMDIVCLRKEDGVHFNIPQTHVYHSPGGMEWGYSGSGPADFALNILAIFLPPPQRGRVRHGRHTNCVRIRAAGRNKSTVVSQQAWELHQSFKEEFIATIPSKGTTIHGERIKNWIELNNDYRFGDR